MSKSIQYTGDICTSVIQLNQFYMEKLIQISPYGSNLLCNITARHKMYTGMVRISSPQQVFTLRLSNSSPDDLVEALYKGMVLQIEEWSRKILEEDSPLFTYNS